MSFAGLTLAQLLLPLGAAAGGVTVLYLLKMRRRQVEVPFAALWAQVLRQSETRKLWRRLRRILSWLMQLVLLGLIALALSDPRPESWLRDARTVAVVIDTSASMGGRDRDGPTRLEQAVTRARGELEALGPNDRALLLFAGAEVVVGAPLGAGPAAMNAALDKVTLSPGEADIRAAMSLARNALAGRAGPEVLLLTDAALPESQRKYLDACRGDDPKQACRIGLSTSEPANLAITAFAARRYPGDREKVEVLAQVHNLGLRPARALLRIEADGIEIGRVELELQPGASERKVISRLDAARDRLEARLIPLSDDPDSRYSLGPGLDDEAFAVVPPVDPLDVVLVSDGSNLFLEGALLTLDDYVRLDAIGPEAGGADAEEIKNADIVFYDLGTKMLPNPLPETNLVIFDPHRNPDSPAPIALDKELKRPRLTEQDRKHPILRGVVFKDINMFRGTSFKLEPGDVPLVSHLGDPIVALREGRHSVLQIGFDPRQSDLPMRVAFPLLVANTVDYFARTSAGFVAALSVGASREVALADLGMASRDCTVVRVTDPIGHIHALAVQQGRFRMRATLPGIHQIEALDGEAAGSVAEIAINAADLQASNLVPLIESVDELDEVQRAGPVPPPVPIDQGPLWTLIILIVAVLSAAEWASYQRRRSV